MIPDAFTEIATRLEISIPFWALVVAIVVLPACIITYHKTFSYKLVSVAVGAGIPALIVAFFPVLTLMMTAFPYNQSTYWKYYEVEGTVESVTNSFQDASGEITSEPVVELDTVDRPIVVTDPRILRMEGEELTFTCQIHWVHLSADRYTCNIAG